MKRSGSVKVSSTEVAAELPVDAPLRARVSICCSCSSEAVADSLDIPASVPCFNDFAVVRPLGRGSYGKVHEISNLAEFKPRRLAMKSYDKAALRKVWVGGGLPGRRPPTALDRIVEREIPCWSRLRHPNLVALMEVINDPSAPAVRCVMELAAGGCSMPDIAPSPPLHVAAVRVLAAQLLDALAAMHEAGVCHRDVKPSNVLLLCDVQRAQLLEELRTVDEAAALPPDAMSEAVAASAAAAAPSASRVECSMCGSPAPRDSKPNDHLTAAAVDGCRSSIGRGSGIGTGFPPVIVKLADFGEALDMCTAEQGGGDLTRATTGTPAFQPPEMLVAGPPFSGRLQDAWMAGMTMYTWLHGSPAFGADGISRFELEDRIRSAELRWEPPDQAAAAAGLPPSMSALRSAVAASVMHTAAEARGSAAVAADEADDAAASGGAGALPAGTASLYGSRGEACAACSQQSASAAAEEQLAQAREVVAGLLEKDPLKRWTVQQARQHPWLRSVLRLPVAGVAEPSVPLRPIEFVDAAPPAPAPAADGAGGLPPLPAMPSMPPGPPGLPMGMPALPPALPGGPAASLPLGVPALAPVGAVLRIPGALSSMPSMPPALGR